MALSPNSAITPQKPRSTVVAVPLTAVANYNTDTPTNTVAIVAPTGFDGARLVKLTVVPRDTTVAARILLFKSPDGTIKRLIDSKDVAAYTWSTTASPSAAQKADFGYSDTTPALVGGNGASASEQFFIGCSVTQSGGGFTAYAEWADY